MVVIKTEGVLKNKTSYVQGGDSMTWKQIFNMFTAVVIGYIVIDIVTSVIGKIIERRVKSHKCGGSFAHEGFIEDADDTTSIDDEGTDGTKKKK